MRKAPPPSFKALGQSGVVQPTRLLERFSRPLNIFKVVMVSDEVTALCPVTGQPDQYTVTITYYPRRWCIESKSLKLKLQSYRMRGLFCEAFAHELADHVQASVAAKQVTVSIVQKPRGGVSIVASAVRGSVTCV